MDTSGSMQGKDYTEVKNAITGEIYDYNCWALSAKDSAMYLYYGTYLKNESSQLVSNIMFGEATVSQIWNQVSPTIDGIHRAGGSESMVSCMYFAIVDMHKRLFEGTDA